MVDSDNPGFGEIEQEAIERARKQRGVLTDAQKNLLLTQPNRGINPIPQLKYSRADFVSSQNNFYIHFHPTWMGELYRAREAYQRFEVIQPELAEQLQTRMTQAFEDAGGYNKPIWEHMDSETWDMLFDAHTVMADLVDEGDFNAFINGEPDSEALTR